jgi:hypothetical protein
VNRWRLRPPYSPEQLAELYKVPHRHDRWPDHLLRVSTSIAVGTWLLRDTREALGAPGPVVADLSTGDAAIPQGILANRSGRLLLGDFAPGYPIQGPIEETIEHLEDDSVDLFVCSETIEHLADPDTVLKRIRAKAHRLLLSTPIDENDTTLNPEHLWGWDVDQVERMLVNAGWRPVVINELVFEDFLYDFMIIGAERA